MISLLLKSILAGLIIAAPTGPTGVMCIRKGLIKKDFSSYMTGFGAATADLVFAIIAGFGITLISSFVFNKQHWFQLIGGFMLVIIGIRDWFLEGNPPFRHFEKRKNYHHDYFSGFFVTIINPITIFSFLAAYSIIGLGMFEGGLGLSLLIVFGSFIGSLLGWTLLNFFVSKVHIKYNQNIFNKINKISGTVLILFGIFLLTEMFRIFGNA